MKLCAAIESGEEADSDLPSLRQVVCALSLGVLLLVVHAWNPVWFHALAELIALALGAAFTLVARQALVPQRHAFVPCAAAGFFWAAALGALHFVLQEGLLDMGGFPADADVVLWLCARTVLALALLLAPWCWPGTYFGKRVFAVFGSISVLCAILVFHGVFPAVFAEGGLFSPFRMAWEWLLVLIFIGAAWLLYQKRAAMGLAVYRPMLAAVGLLVMGELSFSAQPEKDNLFAAAAHLFGLGSYGLMLWVVSQHLLVQPRRLLRRQAELLDDVTSQVPGLAWQLQRSAAGDYRFTFASTGVVDVFELTTKELLADAQLGFLRIVPRDREQLLAAMAHSSVSLTPWKLEWEVVLPRKGRRWQRGESSIPVVQADGSCRWVGHIQDITEEKRVGLELARHRDHLAALVQERTEELRRAMLQTEQAARARTEFLSNMSHEIRTPLNAILGVSQVALRDGRAAPAWPWVRQIHESGRLLLALVNDILDMAKVEAGRMELESRPVRLSAVIERAMRLTAHRAHAQQLDFGVDCGPDLPEGILADETRLTQVLVNLLGNAIKFTERGRVRMSVSRLPAERWLLFAIQDTGIGMSPQQVGQLFQPFTQADASTTRRFGGTGLGLSIAKRIVELMRGRIDVSSQLGHGSCFTLRIPYQEALPPPQQQEATNGVVAVAQRLQGVRVLAAEDDPVNQWVLSDLLEQEGASCRIAANGQAALALLEAGEAFDVFVTDVQMPGLNGYEVARRSRVLRPQLPILGLTAYALPQERQRCLDAGMDEHVTKPVDVDRLCSAILALLGRLPAEVPSEVPAALALAAPVVSMAAAPVLDWSALWRRLRRPASVQRLLQTLLSEHGASAQRLRDSLATADMEEAGQLAHRLLGVAATLFAAPAREAAARLEQHVKSAHAPDPALVAALADATDALLEAARAGLADLDATRNAQGDSLKCSPPMLD